MRVDWKDAVFEDKRKYNIINNSDGTVSLEDATMYTQEGDSFGAKELIEIGKEVNALANDVSEVKKSVSDGKTLIAAAITLKRVATAATDTFVVMAENIAKIVLGSGNASVEDVIKGKTFTNDDGVKYTGTLQDNSGATKMGTASLDTTNSRVQLTVPETAKYSLASKLYATYATIRSLIDLTEEKLWPGITILGITSSKKSISGGTYKPGTSQQTIACGGKAMASDVIISACSLPAASSLKKGDVYSLPSGEKVTGTWEGYVKDNTDYIYNNGENYDGYTEDSSYVQDGYYSVNDSSKTINTTKTYDCDRASGVIVQCHKFSDTQIGSPRVSVYVYDTIAESWQLVDSKEIMTANSADPAAHYFDLGCKSGKLKLRFVLRFVNVTSIRMYV